MRAIPEIAVTFVAAHEGLRLKAYEDVADVVTIGYGHTGPGVKLGLEITERQAKLFLKEDLAIAARRLERVLKPGVIAELTEHQYAALLSFVLNLGCQPSWTIWKVLNAKDFDQVPQQMMRFCYAGGKKVKGLVNRRAAEVALWATDEPGSVPDEPSSAVTRLVDTPPLPAEKPQKVPLIAQAGACLTTCGVAIKTVSDSIAPFAYQSPVVGQMVATLATVAAALVTLTLVLNWLKHRSDRR